MNESKNKPINAAQIRWKCRRGMLELDILFQQFYDQQFSELTEEEQQLFDQMLDEADPLLYEWVLGHLPSETSPYHPIIQKIKLLHIPRDER